MLLLCGLNTFFFFFLFPFPLCTWFALQFVLNIHFFFPQDRQADPFLSRSYKKKDVRGCISAFLFLPIALPLLNRYTVMLLIAGGAEGLVSNKNGALLFLHFRGMYGVRNWDTVRFVTFLHLVIYRVPSHGDDECALPYSVRSSVEGKLDGKMTVTPGVPRMDQCVRGSGTVDECKGSLLWVSEGP